MHEILLQLRLENNLKQSTLAYILGVNVSTYSKYERGVRKIPVDILKKLADFYGTSVDYLSGYTDKRQPYPRNMQSLPSHLSQQYLVAEEKNDPYKQQQHF